MLIDSSSILLEFGGGREKQVFYKTYSASETTKDFLILKPLAASNPAAVQSRSSDCTPDEGYL